MNLVWIEPVERLDDLYNNEVSDFFGIQVKSLQITKDEFIVNDSVKIHHSKKIYTYVIKYVRIRNPKKLMKY